MHKFTTLIPVNMSASQFLDLLEINGMTFENILPHKDERIEKDLVKIRGKTVTIISDNKHVVEAYKFIILKADEDSE